MSELNEAVIRHSADDLQQTQSGKSAVATAKAWSVVMMLARREWTRFFRQRQRVVGALGQPIFFWLLFGTGMHSMFRGANQDFLTYYLQGLWH